MPIKKIKESQMLSLLICPAYLKYDYNLYEPDLSQTTALRALIFFYKDFETILNGKDFDCLIDSSIKKAIPKKQKSFTYKRLYTYCSNFIFSFLNNYPLGDYYPLLLDISIPISFQSYEIAMKYNVILKSLQSGKLLVFNFVHSLDNHIKNNLDYFSAKKNLFIDRLSLVFNEEVEYLCFYISSLKPLVKDQSNNIQFISIVKNNSSINSYIELIKHKLMFKKNPFCINYTCPKRKECSDDDIR